MAKLNEDQQVVLDWMKNEITARAYRNLSDFERLQVLQAFAEWGLSQNG
ncbi:hypothetical protein ACOJB9_08545 [Carnobacterium maltaromaticum]